MNIFIRLLFVFLIFFANSCTKKEEKISIIEEKEINLQMIKAYKEGMKAFKEGDSLFAAKKFNEAEILFPQSEWAPRSILMAAYAYYYQDYYWDAISELERFIKKYPGHERLDYAHFLLAICYYEQIVDEKKVIGPLISAEKELKFVVKNYPDTDFATDGRFKIDLIIDQLAAKEMSIARFYMKTQKWIPALNRLKIVVEKYDKTIFIEEALHRLVEVYYRLGLEEEAKQAASILGYNYKSGEWYKRSYKVFNKKYKPKKIKKEKEMGLIRRKIKSLFE